MKKEITLQFTSTETLWRFWQEFSLKPSHVSFQTKTTTQRLTEEELHLAITKYGAQIYQPANKSRF